MKKDNLSKRLVALSLLGTLTLAHPETIKADHNYNRTEVITEYVPTITAITNVNVRERANTNSKKLGLLRKNQSLRLYEEYAQWYKVGYGNKFGYVNKQYARITHHTVINQKELKTIKTDKALTLYSDESCLQPIGSIPANVLVNVYLDNPYTYYIKYGNVVGYLNKNQINTNTYNNTNYYEVPTYNYNNDPVYNDYEQNNYYIQNNYYGNVEYNYNYYYDDNHKVLIRK